jgi:RNA polymerase sigma-70 factor (ECF subfamily)
MSSEAAYFPGAMASTPETIGSGHCVPEISSELLDVAQSTSDLPAHPVANVVPNGEISDELLLEQIQQGDKEALGILFRRHARAVRNVAYRILRNDAEADDLVQDFFLFLFRKAALFDAAKGAARSWIFQAAYHRAFDRRRFLHSRHFYTSQDFEETARSLTDPGDEIPFHELSIEGIFGKQVAARFNTRLTQEQQETIRLFFFQGYALKEIAQLTGRSLVNVRQHYYRGLARLRKYVLPEKLPSMSAK